MIIIIIIMLKVKKKIKNKKSLWLEISWKVSENIYWSAYIDK